MKVVTKSSQETQNLGIEFAKKLAGGEIIALVGDLGAGKTTFVQGLARGLGIKRRITSPTFIIMRGYKLINLKTKKLKNFYHVDLYRLEVNLKNEIRSLGITEVWGKLENIVVIEWAEKISQFLPQNTKWVRFEVVGENQRRLVIDKVLM